MTVVFGLVFLGLLMAKDQQPAHRNWKEELKAEIDREFRRSVADCAHFNAGSRQCVVELFSANYEHYVLKPAYRFGPPGVPGTGYQDTGSGSPGWQPDLKRQIEEQFTESVAQCAELSPENKKCVERQFTANYIFYVTGNIAGGAPGIPAGMDNQGKGMKRESSAATPARH